MPKKFFKAKSKKVQSKAKLTKEVKMLMKKVRPEVNNWKYIYYASNTMTSTLQSATPLIQCLNQMATGTSPTTRVGDMVKMNYLDLNLQVYRNSTGAQIQSYYRLLVVRETTALGSPVSLSQLFNSATPDPSDSFNYTTRDHRRYHILLDKLFEVGPQCFSTAITNLYNPAVSNAKHFRIKKKLHFTTDYSRGTAGATSDIETNSLYLIVLTDNGGDNTTVFGSFTIRCLDS